MTVRLATIHDIPALIAIRAAVRENRLTNAIIAAADYRPYVADRRCWVWTQSDRIVGFSAIEQGGDALWALFVAPNAEGRGIGRRLLEAAVSGARERGASTLMLSTDARSRAEAFYTRFGFTRSGAADAPEIEMRLTL